MLNIQDLLTHVKNGFLKESSEKDVIVSILKDVLGVEIGKENISMKREVLCIKTDAYVKSEIQLHKITLLKEIHKQKLSKVISDIQ